MMFRLSGLMVLILFYGIYFGKMMAQRRRGIQTDQIARGKKQKKLFVTEVLMKTATYSVTVIQVISLALGTGELHVLLRITGVLAAFAGVACFAASVYTMKDSWRAGIPKEDKTEIITDGIYRFSRNPAFVGFDLTYIGLLLVLFNPVLLIVSVFAIVMLHLQILQEEKYMMDIFGEAYAIYRQHVSRYIGWR